MTDQKNKNSKKPAVGNPAAGSNNKRDKNQSERANLPAKKDKANNKLMVAEKKVPSEEKKKLSLKESFLAFKEKYNLFKIGVVLGVLAAIIVGIVLLICNRATVPDYVKNSEYNGRIENESVAFSMEISENQQEALAKATKVKGNKGAFDFFVNDRIVMAEYDDPALVEFGSVSSNDCVLVFVLYDENGNELYRSLGIEPGKQIRSVEFFDEIAYGTHELTIAVLGYDAKTYEKVGMQTSKIKLEIGVE